MNDKYQMILCIVNSGFSETVMEAARRIRKRSSFFILLYSPIRK